MPWIGEEFRTGGGTCVDECPVRAITLQTDDLAVVDDQTCIRCSTCHEEYTEEAVRHDSERPPQMGADGLEWTAQLLRHYDTPEAQMAFMDRITKYFVLQRKVVERSIEVLTTVRSEPVQGIPAAIQALVADKGSASTGYPSKPAATKEL